jgi:hypothetical protein
MGSTTRVDVVASATAPPIRWQGPLLGGTVLKWNPDRSSADQIPRQPSRREEFRCRRTLETWEENRQQEP